MMSRLDAQTGPQIARRALDLMAQYAIAPTPNNYSVWTAYASASDPGLVSEIDERLAGQQPVDGEFSRELYDRFFTFKRVQDAISKAGDKTKDELGEVVKSLGAAREDTTTYRETLEDAGQQLQTSDDPKVLREVIAGLTHATDLMRQRSESLETRLTQTVGEIDTLRRDLEEVRKEAMTDSLTGLANRKRFDEKMVAARRAADHGGRDLCLLMCDIDHFKRFNDTWGHQIGDQVIRFVANVLRSIAAPPHTVARYGGEEFAIILSGASLGEAGAIAESARSRIENKKLSRKTTGEDLGQVTISLGVSLYRPGESIEALIERCDTNLYKSKGAGRNRLTVDSLLRSSAA